MIVVFVVDTSPSMGEPIQNVHSSNNKPGFKSKSSSVHVGMSRLDLAKMTVESLTKMMERRVHDHNLQVQTADDASPFKSLHNLGFGFAANDQFLLLSTGCQHSSQSTSMACGAGGRLLVSFGPNEKRNDVNSDHAHAKMHTQKIEFEQELKRLKATEWKKGEESFPEDGGGASGLNAALSTGLQLLSRHRLQNRFTENFGLGRLPSNAIMTPTVGATGGVGGMQQATSALQPACLILLTDGDCLRKLPSEGGGSLQLQFGNIPLREFYQERKFFYGSFLVFISTSQILNCRFVSCLQLFVGTNESFVLGLVLRETNLILLSELSVMSRADATLLFDLSRIYHRSQT